MISQAMKNEVKELCGRITESEEKNINKKLGLSELERLT